MKARMMSAVILMTLLASLGCQSDEELRKIKHDIAQIQEQIYQLENRQVELQRQFGKVSENLAQKIEDRREEANQHEKLYSLQDTVLQLSAKIEDLESVMQNQRRQERTVEIGTTPSGEAGPEMPNSVSGTDLEIQFKTCFGDFNRGEYQLAALGFEDLLANYPNSPFTQECYYYLGRSYFELTNWQKASNNFTNLLGMSKDGNFVKPSMLYLGQCYHYLNMPRKAVMKLKELQNIYPNSQESALANSFRRKHQYER